MGHLLERLHWRSIERQLTRGLPADAAGPVLGDLAEDYAARRRTAGRLRAAWWLHREARSLRATYRARTVARGVRIDAPARRWLRDAVQDAQLTARMLKHAPGFASIALITLAVGIGIATVMFTVIEGVLLRPMPYGHPDRLVRINTEDKTDKFGNTGVAHLDFIDLKARSRTLEVAARLFDTATMTAPGDPELLNVASISGNLLSTFEVRVEAGRDFTDDDDRAGAANVAILSDDLWRRRFAADRTAIGARIVFDTRPYTIVGVAPPSLRPLDGADVYTVLGQNTLPVLTRRAARPVSVFGRLQPGVTIDQSRSELATISAALAAAFPDTNKDRIFVAAPLRPNVGGVGGMLWLLFAAVVVVLLIACVNIANLLLARALSRQHEVAVRMALGAGRSRLVRQCLAESLMLAVLGGALGLFIAWLGVQPFVAIWPGTLPRAEAVMLDGRVLLFALGISLVSGIVFGLAPAFGTKPGRLSGTPRLSGRGVTGSSRRIQGAFVVLQIALAMVLLACASLLGRTLLQVSSRDPGVNVHNVLTARTAISPPALRDPAAARLAWQNLLERARHVPGVTAVTMVDTVPLRAGYNQISYRMRAAPVAANEQTTTLATCITPDYLNVTGLALRAGRFFTDADRAGTENVVVVDDIFAAAAFGEQNPIGRQIWSDELGPDPVTVIGVVGHVRYWGLAADDQSTLRAQLYYPFAQLPDKLVWRWSQLMSIAVRTEVDPATVVAPLRQAIVGERRDQVLYQLNTLEELLNASIAPQRFLLLLFSIFAALALALACIGIYGVLAYVTRQRLPEMSVRMALGATAARVRWLVLRQSAGLMTIGVAIGVAGAVASEHVLAGVVQGAEPHGVLSVAVAVPILLMAGLVASLVPARRASKVSPATLLR